MSVVRSKTVGGYGLNECTYTHTHTQKAVTLLQKKGKADGSFLIRPNSRRPGYYALTLVYNSQPYHYEVVCEVSIIC